MALRLVICACLLPIILRAVVADTLANLERENAHLEAAIIIEKGTLRARQDKCEQAIFHLELEYMRLSEEVYEVLGGQREYIQVAKKTEQMLKFAGLNLEHGKPFLLSLAIRRITQNKARPTSTALKFMLADIPADKFVRLSGLLFGLNGKYIKSVGGEIRATGTSTPLTAFSDSTLDGIQLTFESVALQANIEYMISVNIVYDESWQQWHSFGYKLFRGEFEGIQVKSSGGRSMASSMGSDKLAETIFSDIIVQLDTNEVLVTDEELADD